LALSDRDKFLQFNRELRMPDSRLDVVLFRHPQELDRCVGYDVGAAREQWRPRIRTVMR
jgi:hypothetical protein